MFEKFSIAIKALGKFSGSDLDLLKNHLNVRSFPKNCCLLKEGKICHSIYFINRGSLGHYYIANTGAEVTLNLLVENDWVLDYKSFTSKTPSVSVFQAAENSEVLELNIYDLHKLMKISDSFFQIAKVFQYAVEHQESKTQKISPKEKSKWKKPQALKLI